MAEKSLRGDGYISFGVPELEPTATAVVRKSLHTPFYAVGLVTAPGTHGKNELTCVDSPQISFNSWKDNDPARRTTYSAEEQQIMDFQNNSVAQHGPASVAYIR